MAVVAGIDDSPVTRLVIERALEQARWRGTELKLVYVLYVPMVYTEALVDWKKMAAAQRNALWAAADAYLADAEVTVERIDLDGYPLTPWSHTQPRWMHPCWLSAPGLAESSHR